MKRVAVLMVSLWLAGCSSIMTTTEYFWEKPGASAQDYEVDKGQCDAQGFSVAGGNLMQVALVQSGCMRGKGWKRVERQVPRF